MQNFDEAHKTALNHPIINLDKTESELINKENMKNTENKIDVEKNNSECNYVTFCQFKFPILNFDDVTRHRRKLFGIQIKKHVKENNVIKYAQVLENYKNLMADVTIFNTSDHYILKYKLKIISDFVSNERFICKEINILENDFIVFSIPEQHENSFKKLFKQKATTIADSLTSDYIGKVLSGENDETTLNCLELCLSYSLTYLPFNYVNEHMCSFTVMLASMGYSIYCKDNLPKNNVSFAYSFEKSMTGDAIRVCDGIYIHKNRLIVLELKNNTCKLEDPLRYCKERDYIKYVLEYFYKNEPNILNTIEFVCYLGLEFFGKDKGYRVKATMSDVWSIDEFLNKHDFILTNTKLRKIKENHNKIFKCQKFNFDNITQHYLIKKFSKNDVKQIIKFYKLNFINFNSVMRDWAENFKSIGCIINKKIMGALTYKLFECPFKCLDIALMATDVNFRMKGIGKQLIKALPLQKIVVWSDYESVEFYEKLSFVQDEKLGTMLKNTTTYCHDSVFMYFGLSEFDLEIIKTHVKE